MSRACLFSCCCLVFAESTFAQVADSLWQHAFEGNKDEFVAAFRPTAEGGFVFAASKHPFGHGLSDMSLTKTDSLGRVLWSESYGGGWSSEVNDAKQTPDGGFALVGSDYRLQDEFYDGYLVKINGDGVQQWSHRYKESGDVRLTTVAPARDGGFLLAGWAKSSESDKRQVYLVRTDSLGNMLWSRIQGSSDEAHADAAVQDSDGNFLIGGVTVTRPPARDLLWLMEVDSLGGTLWSNTVGALNYPFGLNLLGLSDGGALFAALNGMVWTGDVDLFLARTSKNGDTLWTTTCPEARGKYNGLALRAAVDSYRIAAHLIGLGGGARVIGLAEIHVDGTLERYTYYNGAGGNRWTLRGGYWNYYSAEPFGKGLRDFAVPAR